MVRTTPRIRSRVRVSRGLTKYLLILLGLSLLFWWLLISGSFRVDQVQVDGVGEARQSQVKAEVMAALGQSRVAGLRRDSIWLFPEEEVLGRLKHKFPSLRELSIKRKPPHRVVIKAREERSELLWISGERSYLIGGSGEVLGESGLEKGSDLPQVRDEAALPVEGGKRVASPEFIDFAAAIWRGFEAATGERVVALSIKELTIELQARGSAETVVTFDSTASAGEQLQTLKSLVERAKAMGKRIKDVLLTVEGRAIVNYR